ncbi:MAG: hypothetical protein ACYSUQ_12925 [Planctomycetota bacterium]
MPGALQQSRHMCDGPPPAAPDVGRYALRAVGRSTMARARHHVYAILALGVVLCGGCAGYSQGQWLYMLGFGQGRKGEAEFKLTREGPVVILVDDFEQQIDSPRTRTVLANRLARELGDNQAVKEVVPQERLENQRRRNANFEEISCREVGEMLGAHQVLHMTVREYYAPRDVEETSAAARMTVAVKVLNALEKENKAKVRLWPTQREGRIVSAELNANEVVRAKTPDAVSKLLAAKLAEQVAKLFYEYPLDDFE